jgi:hypothetical protein
MHRRDFLRAAAGGLGAVALGAPAAAEIDSDAKPASVTIDYDQDWLERYQPRLRLGYESEQELTGIYGYRATSDQREYDVACYWMRYAVQDAISPLDSHQYDHEPIYVSVAGDGGVRKVVYSGYHHFSAEVSDDEAPLSSGRTNDETHVSMDVVGPWHHYRTGAEGSGIFPRGVRDWTAVRQEWQAYGFYDRTENAAVDNPYVIIEDRNSWWERSTLDYLVGRIFAQIGVRGGDQRDQLRFEA